eukprot:Phypoly_transcript_04915.p1 GENE.Phypoly_transcript_04915~~Phypoly_transcript_04915.p1  ORF type:complete len:380 (+),score=56.44 Phypoly_transcript_04915:692-1831(+)
MTWLGTKLGYKTYEDLYQIRKAHLEGSRAGKLVLAYFKGSAQEAVMQTYPSFKWHRWLFGVLPQGYWQDATNREKFMIWLSNKLNYKNMSDWYKITVHNFVENGGAGLLAVYNQKPSKAVMEIFNSHKWDPWKFRTIPHSIELSNDQLTDFVKFLEATLKITSPKDWYRISMSQITTVSHACKTVVTKNGGLSGLLSKVYPNYTWKKDNFDEGNKKAMQRWLMVTVSELFPQYEIHEEYVHPELTSVARKKFAFDVYIPSLKLAFEYHGALHYSDVDYYGSGSSRILHDQDRKQKCTQEGITLIEVPYWWNRTKSSLAATIARERPELVSDQDMTDLQTNSVAEPISVAKPVKSRSAGSQNFMLAVNWEEDMDPTGWLS